MAPILDATPHHGEAWVEPVQQELGGTSGAPGAQQLTSRPSAPVAELPQIARHSAPASAPPTSTQP
jgi:hypothetical protein